jgi:hypothetical protein
MTILSLGSLTVLIIASFCANMKAVSDILPSIHGSVLKTSSALSTVKVVTTQLDPGMMDDHSLKKNHTQPNLYVDDNENTTMWQNLNCSDSTARRIVQLIF